jgi:hypothetical protein
MTVSAPDLAFIDLCLYRTPTIGLVDKAINCLPFARRINMVEVEDDWVCFAAIDAPVASHVLPNLRH